MQAMPTVRVRLTEEEEKELLEYGGLKGIGEGIRLYLKAQKSQEIFRKLEYLQRKKNSVKTTSEKEVELIRQEREDRPR